MSDAAIAQLLAGRLPDPDGGPPLGVPTRSVVIADSLAGSEVGLLEDIGFSGRLALVGDANTFAVLGQRIAHALEARFALQRILLPGRPHADQATVEAIRAESRLCDALVAVGSGTINDLCKAAAAAEGKPYAVFGTAPSMNGYTSVTAAITVRGHKKSLPAVAASGVFLDLGVLAAAPPRMIQAGLGDSLCRPTAQADWLLAHLLLGTPYREAPFTLLAADEPALFAESDALMRGDLAAMRRLARTLVLSGFGMTICGGSHPASQGEHLISHYVEMRAPAAWPESFHGEQIGVTTLTMARIQARLLEGDPPRVAASQPDEASIAAHFGPELGAACWREFRAKRLDAAAADTLNARIAERWHVIQDRLRAVTIAAEELQAVLARAGAPSRPPDLRWPAGFYRNAVLHAREIRDRYTFLDLAGDGGRLEELALA